MAFAVACIRAFLCELRVLCASRWDLALNTVLPVGLLVLTALLFVSATPRDLPLVAVDDDHTVLSRNAIRLVDATPGVAVAETRSDLPSAWADVRRGRAYGVFYVPPNAGRDVAAAKNAVFSLYTASSYFTASATVTREVSNAVAALGGALALQEVARRDPAHIRPAPVRVQMTTLFNAGTSYELMVVSILHPAILIILLSVAVMTAVGRECSAAQFCGWVRANEPVLAVLIGKVFPYMLIYFVYEALCIGWLAGMRGYPVAGSLPVLLTGYGLMLVAYTFLGAMVAASVRDVAMALGAAAVYASSALAYSGALFPVRGAVLFTQSWNSMQPYTWYSRISAEQWQMGTAVSDSLPDLGILLLMCVILGAGAWGAVKWTARDAARGTL